MSQYKNKNLRKVLQYYIKIYKYINSELPRMTGKTQIRENDAPEKDKMDLVNRKEATTTTNNEEKVEKEALDEEEKQAFDNYSHLSVNSRLLWDPKHSKMNSSKATTKLDEFEAVIAKKYGITFCN